MIEAYLRTGRHTEAEDLFEQYLDCMGPTGLLPEMYDPVAEQSLGNHPQAYSHLGLIRCARLLATAAPALPVPSRLAAEEVSAGLPTRGF